MRRSATVLVFIAVAVLIAALVSPLTYWAVQAAANSFPALRVVADNSFPRFFTRTLMFAALFGLWPLYFALGKPAWGEVGLRFGPGWSAEMQRGFALGFGAVALLLLGELIAGQREWRATLSGGKVLNAVVLSALAAMLVSPIEEVLFRGVLFGALRSRRNWIVVLFVSSLIFAAAHLMQLPRDINVVTWTSGFELLRAMFAAGESQNQLTQFVNLFLGGVLLAWGFQRTGSVAFSIGLHGGWIIWAKLIGALTVSTQPFSPFWGSRRFIDGWAATVSFLVIAIALPRFTRSTNAGVSHAPRTSKEAQAVG